jgi:hypothetical protein
MLRRSLPAVLFFFLSVASGATYAASLIRCTGSDGRAIFVEGPCPGPAQSPAPAVPTRRVDADADLDAHILQLRRRCESGETQACSQARGLQAARDMRVDMRRRCNAGERLACDLVACDVGHDPAACARSRGQPQDSGFEERGRQTAGGPHLTRISIRCLPSGLPRSVYEDASRNSFEIRRNAASPVVASFPTLADAARHACAHPAP